MILDWKKVAQKIYEELKNKLKNSNKKYKLVAILVWKNSPSLRYIKQKEKWANFVWIDFELINFDDNISQKEIIKTIEILNKDKKTTAFMIQLPLPKHLNEKEIINKINPLKDADWFHPINIWKIVLGDKTALESCTPAWIMKLLEEYNIWLSWKNFVIIWRSNIVWKPLANLAINAWATVTICNSKTADLKFFTKNADIIVVATWKTNLLKVDMINKKSVIIDVWFSIIDWKIFWDCDFDNIEKNGNLITPVPGWVWPMTVAMLIKNVIKAWEIQEKN
jgi:methylenetetrahydrofolate dehydrogenase (NADP+)/methenyltetrahydrofolate cyclohydrolase